ncbi:hypothetical protein CYLTODRAFT_495220 [Cylindrobasidium torrendii FP15055 ss-10]|uniref:Uncharacterized protein n=1 Tax=Cylindrobasidium torrendii FP15055 ss-10 TaxID=1314674 RepID=A0A0D7ATG5_9AGAR|nr:hypothetical protein CYLTODRAFT_495220 [Cylindrobasidium torrendii FP15055 ss-10]
MQTLYRSQDISTCPIFEDPLLYPLLSNADGLLFRVEYMLGIRFGDLRENLFCTDNAIEVQPRMLDYLQRDVTWFIPGQHLCENVLRAAQHNLSCPTNERVLFCNVPDSNPNPCVYTLDLSKVRKTLYTRHPITGHVTAHTAPFPNMPSFSLPASPWIAAIAAESAFRRDSSHPIHRINYMIHRTFPPHHFTIGASSPTLLEVPSPAFDSSMVSSSLSPCEILTSPSNHKHRKRPRQCPASDESPRSSDDEPRLPKRNMRTKKTREHRMDPRSVAKAICPTSHAPRTRAERRRVAQ